MEIEKKAKKNVDIKLFSTPKGVSVIKSPTKAEILSLLKEKEINFESIVEHTKKSKSTISEHLQALVDQGIVDYKVDPKDRRKKIFYIKSQYLGDVSTIKKLEGDEDYLSASISNYEDPFEFYRLLFRTIRVALLKEGISIDPLLHQTGIKLGETYYKELKTKDIKKLIEKIAKFWENNRLGRIEVESIDPLILNAYDCFECEDLPKIGRSACAFDSGILKAIFSAYFQEDVDVEETKCYAKGDNYCCFIIKKI